MIKKIIFIVLALFCSIALLSSWYLFGVRIEHVYNNSLSLISDNYQIIFSDPQYHRGWFHSSSESLIRISGYIEWVYKNYLKEFDENLEEIPPLVITHKIMHGPLIIDSEIESGIILACGIIRSEINIASDAQSDILNFCKNVFPISLKTLIKYDGSMKAEISMPEFTTPLQGEINRKLHWNGMNCHIFFLPDGKKLEIALINSGLSLHIEDEQIDIVLEDIEASIDSKIEDSSINILYNSTRLGRFSISQKGVELFGLRSYQIEQSVQQKEEYFNVAWNFGIGEINNSKKSFGPGQLLISAKNLNVNAFRKLYEEMNKLIIRGIPQDQFSFIAFAKFIEVSSDIFKAKPEFEITRLSFAIDDDTELRGTAKVAFDKNTLISLDEPWSILNDLEAQGNLSIPIVLAKIMGETIITETADSEQKIIMNLYDILKEDGEMPLIQQIVTEILKQLEEEGIIVANGQDYLIDIEFNEGIFYLNGKYIWSLSEIMQ